MRRKVLWSLVPLVVLLSLAIPLGFVVASGDGAVHAVLFYRPDCPNCHLVMSDVLPPLQEQYGDRLLILELDTTTPQGNAFWQFALSRYDLARGDPPRTGVPTLIVGTDNLVGSREIPDRFPALVEQYLAEGGVPLPDFPGIGNVAEVQLVCDPDTGIWSTVWSRYTRDLVGNILSTVVLVGLLVTLGAVIKPREWQHAWARRAGSIGVMVVLLVGLTAAAYLAYVETTGNEAVCGPVGDCNTVQQSEYALLLGFLPVAVLGLIGYLAILGGYVYATWIRGPLSRHVPGLVFLMAVVALVFSIYLTFLEPFVIGATCAWCLTSAVCMLLVNLATAGPGWLSLHRTGHDLGLIKAP